jgi:hypothetical protein
VFKPVFLECRPQRSYLVLLALLSALMALATIGLMGLSGKGPHRQTAIPFGRFLAAALMTTLMFR